MAMTAPAEPTTLRDIAEALDGHRNRINEIEAELATYTADAQSEIAEHREAARVLFQRQHQMQTATFGDLMTVPAPPKARRVRAAANGGGDDYAARVATRNRNRAIRTFAAEKGLALPEKGNDFSQELLDAFAREGGYQG